MDTMVGLAGSPLPNLVAVIFVALAAVVALLLKQLRGWFVLAAVLFAGTVALKNLAYKEIVADPHAENNAAALHSYGQAMVWVVVLQFGLALLLLTLAVRSRHLSVKLFWVATLAWLSCLYAGMCMLGWANTYLDADGKTPVQYQIWAEPLHWVPLSFFAGAFVVTVFAYLSRNKN